MVSCRNKKENMNKPITFSKIAPYEDQDVRNVLNELKEHPNLLAMLQFIDIKASSETLIDIFDSVSTIEDFQLKISTPWLTHFFGETTSEITFDGIDTLDPDQKHLFISNHRDIILDSAILNVLFAQHKIQTLETAIGDNLLKSRVVKKLAKLNKNFTVIRSGGPKEIYAHSLILSAYIRDKIVGRDSSVWIAQREGRAKDGNDKTQQGLLKMLNLSNKEGFEEGFRELKMRPISMSYEYDPCDRFKVKELLALEAGKVYEKEEGEDLANIIAGIKEYKGHVHLSIQPVLDEELEQLKVVKNINEKAVLLAGIIDRSIYRAYKLFSNNYVAYDLLKETKSWEGFYSREKKEEFEEYLHEVCKSQPPEAKTILLRKYAYPLINQLNE